MTMTKPQSMRMLIVTAMATASAVAVLVAASGAHAQSVSSPCTSCGPVGGVVPTPTIPTTPTATIPTPPPVVVIPPPPPVVVVTTPTPPRMPERPNTWMNVPSDMSKLTQFDSVSSINRLLRDPTSINLTIPRAPVQNKLENRLISPAGSASAKGPGDAQDALQALENAKPLI